MIDTARRSIGGNIEDGWAGAARRSGGLHALPLYKHATQTVFGEGPIDAAMMLVGEQPGDQEDLAGRPFVGPGGASARPRAGRGGH